MDNFWCTSDNIPKGLGFDLFGPLHLTWLGFGIVLIAANCLLYRRLGERGRKNWRITMGMLLLADELFMLIPMFIFGTFRVKYLPFELCSINIFIVVWHVFKPNKLTDNFLYTVCIPGALAALLFPSWTKLPAWNYMMIHSFTVHILLMMYPAVLVAGKDIRPEIRQLPKALVLLAGLAAVALVLNLIWDTNFMFLMRPGKGNPLEWFEDNRGNHLYGFPVLILGIVAVLYGPLELYRRLRKDPKLK